MKTSFWLGLVVTFSICGLQVRSLLTDIFLFHRREYSAKEFVDVWDVRYGAWITVDTVTWHLERLNAVPNHEPIPLVVWSPSEFGSDRGWTWWHDRLGIDQRIGVIKYPRLTSCHWYGVRRVTWLYYSGEFNALLWSSYAKVKQGASTFYGLRSAIYM